MEYVVAVQQTSLNTFTDRTHKRMGYTPCKDDLMAYSLCILFLFEGVLPDFFLYECLFQSQIYSFLQLTHMLSCEVSSIWYTASSYRRVFGTEQASSIRIVATHMLFGFYQDAFLSGKKNPNSFECRLCSKKRGTIREY